jgi:regulator of protease activity HflC (stomatin/prohibitin superfamily)
MAVAASIKPQQKPVTMRVKTWHKTLGKVFILPSFFNVALYVFLGIK